MALTTDRGLDHNSGSLAAFAAIQSQGQPIVVAQVQFNVATIGVNEE